jgi:PAS domain S-box-containing protein
VKKKQNSTTLPDETLFRNLFENDPEGIYITGPDGSVIDVNKSALEITGFKTQSGFAKQDSAIQFLHPGDRRKFLAAIKKYGSVIDLEVSIRKKTGDEVFCMLSSLPLKDKKGKIIGHQGIIRDITKQKRQQKIQETLLKITEAATSTKDIKTLLKQLHKELAQLINADNFYVALYDEDADAYSFPHYADEFDKINEFEQMTLKKSLTDYIRRKGEALFVDREMRTRLKKSGEAIMIGTQSPIWLGSPLITSKGVIGVVVVQSYRDPNMYTRDDLELLVFISGQIARVIEQKQADEEIRNSNEQLRHLSAHLHSVREEESKRIARDLHDSLGQILTALKFDISMLDKQLDEQFPAKEHRLLKRKTKSMISKVDATVEAMRRISANLRPAVLDDMGLNAAIEWLTGDFGRRTNIGCVIHLDSEDEIISDREAATTLYRIVQEALTNIIKHSNASNVNVSLIRNSKDIVLTISDDGMGISKEKIKKTTSFGLVGIQERALGLGGVFEIEGEQGVGTTLTVSIPITR